MKYQLYLIAFFLSLYISVNAQDKRKRITSNDVIIEGRITDSLIYITPGQKATVTLRISTFPTSGVSFPATKYVLELDSNQYFKFIIPAPATRFYMDIFFNPIKTQYWSFIDNIYILEKGDRITCNLSSNYFEFSGRGSAKLNCQSAIYKYRYKITEHDRNFAKNNQLNEVAKFNSQKLDSLLKLRLAVVRKFAPNLGKEMTDILLANCYGMRYYNWLRTGYITSQTAQKYQEFINSTPYKNIDFSLNQKIDTKILVGSPIYCDFLFEKIGVESLRCNDWKTDRSEQRNQYIYKRIKENYSGVLREKLLTIFLLKTSNSFSWLAEVSSMIKRNDYIQLLTRLKKAKADGLSFYPFELENSEGKIVRLADFKDKIILLDFWFTGCSPCKQLNEAMQPVIEKYKDNPNIRFVTVSIDSRKSEWLKSVISGKYTHHQSINLYAGGKDAGTITANPLLTHYDISSFPTLFLIKDGKMYSSNPPVPLLTDEKSSTNGNTKKLIELIDSALYKSN